MATSTESLNSNLINKLHILKLLKKKPNLKFNFHEEFKAPSWFTPTVYQTSIRSGNLIHHYLLTPTTRRAKERFRCISNLAFTESLPPNYRSLDDVGATAMMASSVKSEPTFPNKTSYVQVNYLICTI